MHAAAAQVNAGDAGAADFGQIEREPAPAATDVEYPVAVFDQELGREMPPFRELRIIKRLLGMLEIGAHRGKMRRAARRGHSDARRCAEPASGN